MVALWFSQDSSLLSFDDFEAGNPLDRNINLVLMLCGAIILAKRLDLLKSLPRQNLSLVIFFIFSGIGILWSDFPFVALKRWIRTIGNLLMVLVVLTEPSPFEAVKTLLRRTAYMLIPLSIVLYKYFPHLGRMYHSISGELFITGVTTNKNTLGSLCAFSTFIYIDELVCLRSKKTHITTMEFAVPVLMIAMSLWLLYESKSATSLVCLAFGCLLYWALTNRLLRNRLKHVGRFFVIAIVVVSIIQFAGLDLFGLSLAALGRDPTLTGRTDLWKELVEMVPNPILGVGYQSFWLGSRLAKLWGVHWWQPTEAHNGYLEVYLELGLLGLLLLFMLLRAAYYSISYDLMINFDEGRLKLALFGMVLVYNITEAGFAKNCVTWFILLMISIRLLRPCEERS